MKKITIQIAGYSKQLGDPKQWEAILDDVVTTLVVSQLDDDGLNHHKVTAIRKGEVITIEDKDAKKDLS